MKKKILLQASFKKISWLEEKENYDF